jgi:DNA-binding transcriptional LysR family regulator
VHVALLPRVLRPFSRSFPEVQLKIVEGLFPAMEAELYDGSIDFYVGPFAEDSASSEFIVEKLFDNLRMVVGRRNQSPPTLKWRDPMTRILFVGQKPETVDFSDPFPGARRRC